jgi:hypothetical protein
LRIRMLVEAGNVHVAEQAMSKRFGAETNDERRQHLLDTLLAIRDRLDTPGFALRAASSIAQFGKKTGNIHRYLYAQCVRIGILTTLPTSSPNEILSMITELGQTLEAVGDPPETASPFRLLSRSLFVKLSLSARITLFEHGRFPEGAGTPESILNELEQHLAQGEVDEMLFYSMKGRLYMLMGKDSAARETFDIGHKPVLRGSAAVGRMYAAHEVGIIVRSEPPDVASQYLDTLYSRSSSREDKRVMRVCQLRMVELANSHFPSFP